MSGTTTLLREAIKETIVRGVQNSQLAYVGKTQEDEDETFYYGSAHNLTAVDIDVSDDTFIVTEETAETYKKQQTAGISGGAPQPPGTAAPMPVDHGQSFPSRSRIDETRSALRELGLNNNLSQE